MAEEGCMTDCRSTTHCIYSDVILIQFTVQLMYTCTLYVFALSRMTCTHTRTMYMYIHVHVHVSRCMCTCV